MASVAAAACVRIAVRRRAYGGGYGRSLSGDDLRRHTEMKRERETQQFYMFQRQIISRGGVDPKDDAHWDMLEKKIFGQTHVKAGINFAKYDNIEVTAEGGTGKEQPISATPCFKVICRTRLLYRCDVCLSAESTVAGSEIELMSKHDHPE